MVSMAQRKCIGSSKLRGYFMRIFPSNFHDSELQGEIRTRGRSPSYIPFERVLGGCLPSLVVGVCLEWHWFAWIAVDSGQGIILLRIRRFQVQLLMGAPRPQALGAIAVSPARLRSPSHIPFFFRLLPPCVWVACHACAYYRGRLPRLHTSARRKTPYSGTRHRAGFGSKHLRFYLDRLSRPGSGLTFPKAKAKWFP